MRAASRSRRVPPVDDQAAYNAAFDKLKAGNYSEAMLAFQAFMNHYPSSDLLDNAQYWIGEAYYVTRDYEHAARAFRAVGRALADLTQGARTRC